MVSVPIKLVVVGDDGVGKTCLVIRYATNNSLVKTFPKCMITPCWRNLQREIRLNLISGTPPEVRIMIRFVLVLIGTPQFSLSASL